VPLLVGVVLLLLLPLLLLPLLLLLGVRREASAAVVEGVGREGGRASLSCGSGGVSMMGTTGGVMVFWGRTERRERRIGIT